MGTRSKKSQPAASGAAATSDVNDSTEADANDSTESDVVSGPLGQPVTIEQISSLFQVSQAALKAELQVITSRLDTMQSSMTTIQTGLKDMQNEVKTITLKWVEYKEVAQLSVGCL